MKGRTTISVDTDLLEKAQSKGLNVSAETTKILREKTQGCITDEEELECSSCGAHLPKQTPDNLKYGLVWLCPDERWICPSCLNFKIRKTTIAIATRR